ncbi:MAG: Rab proteins geranylgeranyltransferase component A [Claussenomyces sp. TS43310]|nr:MAG: Rab proteins geranylgeranyltransferase component A [Claussenomyces sp. TS43310]
MESLSETPWDVVIAGTGLQQSLLALALSRSDKKVLHLDENDFYGGAEAAFSLQEAEEWVANIGKGTLAQTFGNASTWKAGHESDSIEGSTQLSFSRAYTLALSPQIIYTRSKLLSQLVSSKVYRQLEFQAVGHWWLYKATESSDTSKPRTGSPGNLLRLPNGREDVFADRSIDVRAKRSLMKFLRFVVNYEDHSEVWHPHVDSPLPDFLSSAFLIPSSLQPFIMALTLSLDIPSETTVAYALPRIARHLSSIGVLGPGFGAVVPKWGGGSEIAQVACRAGAVGGGVYILGTGITKLTTEDSSSVTVSLSNDEKISAGMVFQPRQEMHEPQSMSTRKVSNLIAIVSSDLPSLFVSTVEGAPTPAVSVIAFPPHTLDVAGNLQAQPVYIMAHSSDTGECPAGQCVLYASTLTLDDARSRLDSAISRLLASVAAAGTEGASKSLKLLYALHYEQTQASSSSLDTGDGKTYTFPPSSVDLAFDDTLLDRVEDAWRRVMNQGAPQATGPEDLFMVFPERAGFSHDDDRD